MKMIPLLRCRNMKDAIAFYTGVLDFYVPDENASDEDVVVVLANGEAELMLTLLEGDQKEGIAANVLINSIDDLFRKICFTGTRSITSHRVSGAPWSYRSDLGDKGVLCY